MLKANDRGKGGVGWSSYGYCPAGSVDRHIAIEPVVSLIPCYQVASMTV